MKRVFKQDRTAVYEKRIANKGERWVNKKGHIELTKAMGVESDKPRDIYFRALQRKGYDALLDLNDTGGYGSTRPILIFNGDKSLKGRDSVELTTQDIQKASNAYKFRKDLLAYDETELHSRKS